MPWSIDSSKKAKRRLDVLGLLTCISSCDRINLSAIAEICEGVLFILALNIEGAFGVLRVTSVDIQRVGPSDCPYVKQLRKIAAKVGILIDKRDGHYCGHSTESEESLDILSGRSGINYHAVSFCGQLHRALHFALSHIRLAGKVIQKAGEKGTLEVDLRDPKSLVTADWDIKNFQLGEKILAAIGGNRENVSEVEKVLETQLKALNKLMGPKNNKIDKPIPTCKLAPRNGFEGIIS